MWCRLSNMGETITISGIKIPRADWDKITIQGGSGCHPELELWKDQRR